MEPSREPPLPAGRLRRLTAAEYMWMVDAGVFGEHERLELLDGVLCKMSPQSVPHARIIQVLSRMLFRQLSEQHDLRVQLPLQLGELSVPEPDLAVVESKEVEVYRAPDSETEAYTERITVGRSEALSCRSVPGLSVPPADLW
ncbi:Uma2 family endonuclease [Archangium lansingense]|uniref:Uma2 family endonuclease n=1 Tax=Archangium lansingense TaxID=2995310 RepID=A0ABT4AN19_9BACT|nr:Uma2 family endonuclease [Archangium lansinium]MCY1083085.1 Uma2 family endonuclease [Archangium lansinium]